MKTNTKTKDKFVFRKLGGIRVKGKSEPVNVYELICEKDKEPDGLDGLLKKFEECFIVPLIFFSKIFSWIRLQYEVKNDLPVKI